VGEAGGKGDGEAADAGLLRTGDVGEAGGEGGGEDAAAGLILTGDIEAAAAGLGIRAVEAEAAGLFIFGGMRK